MKNILHISDLHLGFENMGARLATILRDIRQRFDPAKDVIVLSGDLVHEPLDSSFIAVRNHIRALRREGQFEVLICPGNHDYTVGVNIVPDKERINVYAFQSYFEQPDSLYPIVYDEVDNDMVFIGVDTMPWDIDWSQIELSQGKIGDMQLQRLDNLLKNYEGQGKEIILFMHHRPFAWDEKLFGIIPSYETLKLVDKDKLFATIAPNDKSRVSMLLFGHSHLFQLWKAEDGNCHGIPLCSDAGTSTGKGSNKGTARYMKFANGAWQAEDVIWNF